MTKKREAYFIRAFTAILLAVGFFIAGDLGVRTLPMYWIGLFLLFVSVWHVAAAIFNPV